MWNIFNHILSTCKFQYETCKFQYETCKFQYESRKFQYETCKFQNETFDVQYQGHFQNDGVGLRVGCMDHDPYGDFNVWMI